jgi:lysophospholipase L1-like esterase
MCGVLPAATAPQFGIIGFHRARADNMVVIGDSLSAGFQNYSLYDSTSADQGTCSGICIPATAPVPAGGQTFGFAAQIAKRAGVSLNLPLISYPGLPPVLTLNPADGLLQRGSVVGSREPQTLAIQTRNLSVPGFALADALSYSVSPTALTNPATASVEDLLALEVLGYPSLNDLPNSCGVVPMANGSITISALGCAVKLKPSLAIVSIGSNDVVPTILGGAPPTDPAVFQAEYLQLVSTLKLTGAEVILANIPDVTLAPILQSYAQFEARCGVPPSGATPADYVVPDLTNATLSSFNVCTNYLVRPAALIAQARSTVQQYNRIIQSVAASVKAPVVDLYGLVNQLAAYGYEVRGAQLTTQYLGGLFSLDGLHPTNTGYAIMANAFISVMNRDFHMLIPPIAVEQVAATDPLIFPVEFCPTSLGESGCVSVR